MSDIVKKEEISPVIVTTKEEQAIKLVEPFKQEFESMLPEVETVLKNDHTLLNCDEAKAVRLKLGKVLKDLDTAKKNETEDLRAQVAIVNSKELALRKLITAEADKLKEFETFFERQAKEEQEKKEAEAEALAVERKTKLQVFDWLDDGTKLGELSDSIFDLMLKQAEVDYDAKVEAIKEQGRQEAIAEAEAKAKREAEASESKPESLQEQAERIRSNAPKPVVEVEPVPSEARLIPYCVFVKGINANDMVVHLKQATEPTDRQIRDIIKTSDDITIFEFSFEFWEVKLEQPRIVGA